MQLNKLKNISTFLFVLITYCYITSYLATFNNSIVNPRNLFFMLFLYSVILIFLNNKKLFIFKLPVFYWIIFYLSIVFTYFILNNHLDDLEFRKLIFAILFFLCLLVIMSYDEKLTFTRKAILFATLIAIFNNIYEFLNPFAFYAEHSGLKIMGRSAGFYINSNISGEAIILGLLFTFEIIPKKFKYLFLIICFLGIAVTFSRAALIGYFIIIFFFIKNGQLNKSLSITIFVSFIMLMIIALPFLEDLLKILFGHNAENLINRLNFFTGNAKVDFSELERKQIALTAFNLFADNLPFGAGLGVTEHWNFKVSAHNMYLIFMAQFGLIGFFLYPLLIFSVVYKSQIKRTSTPFTIYLLFIGFTTHNVLDAYHLLTALAFMGNLTLLSRQNNY